MDHQVATVVRLTHLLDFHINGRINKIPTGCMLFHLVLSRSSFLSWILASNRKFILNKPINHLRISLSTRFGSVEGWVYN